LQCDAITDVYMKNDKYYIFNLKKYADLSFNSMFPNTNVIPLFVKTVPEQLQSEIVQLFRLFHVSYLYSEGEVSISKSY
jgi:hypothetical protein